MAIADDGIGFDDDQLIINQEGQGQAVMLVRAAYFDATATVHWAVKT